MKQYQAIPYKGINRAAGRYATDGICDEQINCSRRTGMLRPVGDKSVVQDYTTNLTDYSILYRHPVLPDHDLVGVRDDIGEIHRIFSNASSTPGPDTEVIVTMSGTYPELGKSITHLGNVVIIQTDQHCYYIKYDADTDTYTHLPRIPMPQFSIWTDPDRDDTFNTATRDTLKEAIADYNYTRSQMGKDGFIEGHTLCIMAYKMSDGTYIGHSQVMDAVIGPEAYQFTNLYKAGGKYAFNMYAAKLKGKYAYQPNDRNDFVAPWEGIITSLCLFIAHPVSKFNADTDESLYTQAHEDYYNLPKNKDLPELMQSSYLFYQIHEIGLSSIVTGNDAMDFTPNIGSLDVLETKPQLTVDQNTHHTIAGATSAIFNNRLHYGNVYTRLGHGVALDAYVGDDDIVPDQWGYTGYTRKSLDDTWWIAAVTSVHTSNGVRKAVSYHYQDPSIGYRSNQGGNQLAVWEKNGSADLILLNHIITYPDARAFEMDLYLHNTTSGKYYKWQSVPLQLKPHTFLNVAYHLNWDANLSRPQPKEILLNSPGTEISANAFIAATAPDPTYIDTNRIQVSLPDNPFVMPAENSYRVGSVAMNVISIQTIGEAISQGQFGQFPLYVFTSEGIWTLQQGSGEVLYAAINPISPDVPISEKTIVSTGRGVAYATTRGLFLMEGNQIKEISVPMEGMVDNPLSLKNDYLGFLDDLALVQLSDKLCTMPFNTYLQGSILGYDPKNREIIVSYVSEDSVGNADGQYSFVYGLETGEWYKITRSWLYFLNAYPETWGVDFDQVYSLSQEETTDRDILVQTRPMTLGKRGFKKVIRAVQDGYFEVSDEHFCGFYLYGSQDGIKWYLLGGKQQGNTFATTSTKRADSSCRYFIVVLAASLSLESVIDVVEVEYDTKFETRTR